MTDRTYFFTIHATKPNDTLYKLTRAYKFGNPAAIVDFPPNFPIFSVRRDLGWMPDIELEPSERPAILIPWHREALLRFAQDKVRERVQAVEAAHRRLAAVGGSLARMETSVQKHLAQIDTLATFASLFASLAVTVQHGIKMSKAAVESAAKNGDKVARAAEAAARGADDAGQATKMLMTKEQSIFLADVFGGLLYQPPISMLLPQPADLGHGWKWWLSNTLGWWNPSKWTAVYGAVKEGDADIAFHGTAAVRVKRFNQALARERRALKKKSAIIDKALRAAARQANDAYYQKRYNLLTSPLGKRSWRVSAGDSLVSISQRFYHTDAHWKTIYRANKKIIGPDPGRLCIGMSLDIPHL